MESRPNSVRLRPFRAFANTMYWENRREYEGYGQTPPYTFDEYWRDNRLLIINRYRKKEVDNDSK